MARSDRSSDLELPRVGVGDKALLHGERDGIVVGGVQEEGRYLGTGRESGHGGAQV